MADKIIYKNKYRKLFLDSFYNAQSNIAIEGLTYNPFDFEDPSMVGFTVRFDFSSIENLDDFENLDNSLLKKDNDRYAAVQYLENINEPIRAEYLRKFIATLESLQKHTPWYMQTISGLDALQKIDPTKGMRVPEDASITIEMLESIDMRVSYLKDLYVKAAWDPIYHRWMLPENMRWFKVEIIISEYRDFHLAKQGFDAASKTTETTGKEPGVLKEAIQGSSTAARLTSTVNRANTAKDRINAVTNPDGTKNDPLDLLHENTGNVFLPMHVIVLDMCEFTFFDNRNPYIGNLNNADGGEFITQSLSFKPGRIREISDYTLQGLLLRDDSLRQMTASTQTLTADYKMAMMNTEDVELKSKRDELDSTTYVKERFESVTKSVVGRTVDNLAAGLFLSSAFDGQQINDHFNAELEEAREALSNEVVKLTTNQTGGNTDDLGYSDFEPKYPSNDNDETVKNPYGPETGNSNDLGNVELKQDVTNEVSPTNIGGFDIPDMNVDTLGNVDL